MSEAAAARGRRTLPGPPSPCAGVGWCGAAPRLRDAAQGARRPWWMTFGPSSWSSPSTCQRIKYSNRNDTLGSCQPGTTAGQRPRPDFWHPTRGRQIRVRHRAARRRPTPHRRLLSRSPQARVAGHLSRRTAPTWFERGLDVVTREHPDIHGATPVISRGRTRLRRRDPDPPKRSPYRRDRGSRG